jgi:hypothetical protein
MRMVTEEWIEAEIAPWSSVFFVSLSFKLMIYDEPGRALHLSEAIARREIVLFGKRVDRAVHGRLVQRFNRRVRRIPFLEHGNDRGWHAHILMEKPEGMADVRFNRIIKVAWGRSAWSVNLHERAADDGAPAYLAKERSPAI